MKIINFLDITVYEANFEDFFVELKDKYFCFISLKRKSHSFLFHFTALLLMKARILDIILKMKLLFFILTVSLQLIFGSEENCTENLCKENWLSVGRYCIKFNKAVKYFSDAHNLCKSFGLNSNIFSKSSFVESELQILIKEINKQYPNKPSHSFWVNFL